MAGQGKALFSPSEEEAVIRERFLVGSSTTRGEAPFKRLVKRYAIPVLDTYIRSAFTDAMHEHAAQRHMAEGGPVFQERAFNVTVSLWPTSFGSFPHEYQSDLLIWWTRWIMHRLKRLKMRSKRSYERLRRWNSRSGI